MSRQNYIAVAPRTPKGRHQVFSRRIGSEEKFSFFAEAVNEAAADAIVRALNNETHSLVRGGTISEAAE